MAGAPFQAAVEVSEHRDIPQQKHLELQIDGAARRSAPTLSLPPGGSLKYDFRFTLDREGVHRGEVRLVEDDGSALDNQLYFAVTRRPAGACWRSSSQRRDEVPQADDAFYLERALAPGGSVGGAFRITTLTPESLATGDISGQAVVFCVNLPALAPRRRRSSLPMPVRAATSSGSAARMSSRWRYNAMNALAQGQLCRPRSRNCGSPFPAASRAGTSASSTRTIRAHSLR